MTLSQSNRQERKNNDTQDSPKLTYSANIQFRTVLLIFLSNKIMARIRSYKQRVILHAITHYRPNYKDSITRPPLKCMDEQLHAPLYMGVITSIRSAMEFLYQLVLLSCVILKNNLRYISYLLFWSSWLTQHLEFFPLSSLILISSKWHGISPKM